MTIWSERGFDGPPRFVTGGAATIEGRRPRFDSPPHLGCEETDAPRAHLRVARLDAAAVVVGCGADVSVYVEVMPGTLTFFRL